MEKWEVIDQDTVDLIKNWLELDPYFQKRLCPFDPDHELNHFERPHYICHAIWPDMKDSIHCPCAQFGLKRVLSDVQALLKEWDERK